MFLVGPSVDYEKLERYFSKKCYQRGSLFTIEYLKDSYQVLYHIMKLINALERCFFLPVLAILGHQSKVEGLNIDFSISFVLYLLGHDAELLLISVLPIDYFDEVYYLSRVLLSTEKQGRVRGLRW